MKLVTSSFLVLVVALLFSGCNIFDFTASDDDQTSVVEEAKQLMRDGEYQEAFTKLNSAVNDDPNDSVLRYLRAKCAMRLSGENPITMSTELASLDTEDPTGAELPFMNRTTWPNDRADRLYQGIQVAIEDINTIYSGLAVGDIDSSDVQIDNVVCSSINAILMFRDNNLDKKIDDSDFDLSMFFRAGDLNQDGLDSLSGDQINLLLDNIENLLDQGFETLNNIIGDSLETGLNNEDLEKVIGDLKGGANFYRYNDGIDNDGDGRIDEEYLNKIDDDLDGLVDEDTKPMPVP